MKLGQHLTRLVEACEQEQPAFQYALGLQVLITWDIKHLFEQSAMRSTTVALRNHERLAYMARNTPEIQQQVSPRTRQRRDMEMRAHLQHDLDPEDLYVDDVTEDYDDDVFHPEGDDVSTEHHDADEHDEHNKLQCFVEWDFFGRGD